jgi:hypothetical protein
MIGPFTAQRKDIGSQPSIGGFCIRHHIQDRLQPSNEHGVCASGRILRESGTLPFDNDIKRRCLDARYQISKKIRRPYETASAALPTVCCHLLHGLLLSLQDFQKL